MTNSQARLGRVVQNRQTQDEFDREDGLLAFSLAIHNLLLVCSLILVVGNVNVTIRMTLLGIAMLSLHYILCEGLMRAVRKQVTKYSFPVIPT